MKPLLSLLVILLSAPCVSYAGPIEEVEEVYAKRLEAITKEYEKKLSELNEAAAGKMERIKVDYTKKGDLENALRAKTAAEKYAKGIIPKDRFEKHGGVDIKAKPEMIGNIPLNEVRFLDYINRTWNNDISDKYTLRNTGEGLLIEGEVPGGYAQKMILFNQGNPKRDVLKGSLTLLEGSLGIGLKPRDLAPRGSVRENAFPLGRKVDFKFYVKDDVPCFELDGKNFFLPKKPEDYGWFHFMPARRIKLVVHSLEFDE